MAAVVTGSGVFLRRLLTSLTKALHRTRVYSLRHAVEIDKQAEEHLVCCRTVFMNPAQVAQDGYAGHILSVECQHTCCLLAQASGPFRRRYLPMKILVLLVIRGGDLGQQPGDHFNDIGHRHFRYLILWGRVVPIIPCETRRRL